MWKIFHLIHQLFNPLSQKTVTGLRMFETQELVNIYSLWIGLGSLAPSSLHIGHGLPDVPADAGGVVLHLLDVLHPQPHLVPHVVLVVFIPVNLPVLVQLIQGEEHFEVVSHCFLQEAK